MDQNLVLPNLECDVGVAGSVNTVTVPPSVVVAAITAIAQVISSLYHSKE